MNTTLDFLRHGSPVGGRKYRGQTDDPLSEKGWTEMRAATAAPMPWRVIVTSPLSRCRAFAEVLAQERGLPLSDDARLKEVGFGTWEGLTAAQIELREPGAVQAFKRDPLGCRPSGAEPLAAFHERVSAAYEALLAAHRGGHVLVVCHAGVMRMAIAHAIGLPAHHAYRLQIASAALARIRVEEGEQGRFDTLQYLTPGPTPT